MFVMPQCTVAGWLTNLSGGNSCVQRVYAELSPELSSMNYSFYKCSKLTKLELTSTHNVVAAMHAFDGCEVLPTDQFPTDWGSLSDGTGMFLGCALLGEATANTILDSLPDWSGENPPASHVITFTGTAAETAWAEHASDPDAMAAINKARSYGWTVVGAPEPSNQ